MNNGTGLRSRLVEHVHHHHNGRPAANPVIPPKPATPINWPLVAVFAVLALVIGYLAHGAPATVVEKSSAPVAPVIVKEPAPNVTTTVTVNNVKLGDTHYYPEAVPEVRVMTIEQPTATPPAAAKVVPWLLPLREQQGDPCEPGRLANEQRVREWKRALNLR
jgi:hypothetical protein